MIDSVPLSHGELVFGRAPLPPLVPVFSPGSRFVYEPATDCFLPVESVMPRIVDPPEDLFLRVAQINPHDIDGLTALMNAYGSPGIDPATNLDGLNPDHLTGRR